MKCVCPKHGSSLHYHVCRHVKAACHSGGPLPNLDPASAPLISRVCLTDEVREFLSRSWSFPTLDEKSDESIEENLGMMFYAYRALQLKIGYSPLCTECLYEKTGFDRRRRPAENSA